MSEQLFWFLIGFLAAFLICLALVGVYLVYARRRVRILRNIINERIEAAKAFGEATSKAYPPKPKP